MGHGFSVNLNNYAGPFDALLSMIANKRLELTEVSLCAITEEFLEYVHGLDFRANIDQTSAFIDVASVLIEAKSAALLPGGADGQRDEQSMEALRERDLLFARLLQYRAFKEAAGDFQARLDANAGAFAHPAVIDVSVAARLPELEWPITARELAALAAQVLANAPAEHVATRQLHVPLVDLRAQSSIVRERLSALPSGTSMTFGQLVQDAASRIEVVARFLAILAFFKQGRLQFRQSGPYEQLDLRWVARADAAADDARAGFDADISESDFA